MTSFSPRAALAVLALVTITAGCASGRRSEGSVDKPVVTAADLARNSGRPIEEVLQAKVPGLFISRTPDGGIALQVRGISSFMSSNQPLFVIDDVPIQPGPGGALIGVNPYDIESIKVLKNPEDVGVYGMRGANGVILIKMKAPGKRGD